MKKTERLFRIIDRLRGHSVAVTAAQLASEFSVSERTIYRDMKSLEEQAIPVEGEAGVGYMLGAGFDAPPMTFDRDELDALVIGLRLVGREADPILQGAALSALEKIRATSTTNFAPEDTALYAPNFGHHEHLHMMSVLRLAIRNATVMELDYEALSEERTTRTVKPLALIFFPNAHLLAAWCELRQDYRNFRMDRIVSARDIGENFVAEKRRLLRGYKARANADTAQKKTAKKQGRVKGR